MEQIIIPSRFNGPAGSGNGGYSCGMLAAFLDGPARVRLHSPPPLDTPLAVSRGGAGTVAAHLGERLVATGSAAQLEFPVPSAPRLAEAEIGRSRFPFYKEHLYPTCFVCGPRRPGHDGLEIYTGPVTDWSLLACPWQPESDLLDTAGFVRPEFVWSALDCPGGHAAMGGIPMAALLGELTLEQYAPVPGSEPLIVFAWPLGRDGRKYHGGAAIADCAGRVLAAALSTWIRLKS